MPGENFWLLLAALLYGAATLFAVIEAVKGRSSQKAALVLLGLALLANTVSILLRWDRLGHGPYVDLRETLSSSLWGYHLALFLAAWLIPKVRPILATVMPVLLIMVVWALLVPPRDSSLPVTYDTYWLPTHILLGKVFIGCVVVALGCALVVLLRRLADRRGKDAASAMRFSTMPADTALDELSFRFMLGGFVFDTAMLITGAIWAQNAWGRYWDWDPLETWSFLTWLCIAAYLHLRITKRPPPVVGAGLVLVAFILAFLTYFGLPFISTAAHQGVV